MKILNDCIFMSGVEMEIFSKASRLMAAVLQQKHTNPSKSLPMQQKKRKALPPSQTPLSLKVSTTKAHRSSEQRERLFQVIKCFSLPGTKQIRLNKATQMASF